MNLFKFKITSKPLKMIPINENAPVKAKKSIQIDALPQIVWKLLSEIDKWNEWNQDIKQSKLNGELEAGSTFDWSSGGAKISSTLHSVIPQKVIGWSGKAFGAYAIHNWSISEVNGNTEVWVEESMEGTLMRIFRGYMQNILDNGMNRWLEQLKEAAEKN